ncbi:dUTP diphosphatase [Desulfurispirillum indicum]|uniref:dUTP diphosphatase n=1 Tax=Desulfurispirillum indicum (strain ATCC BAA-1389 / DSM 22839 / S5) TaxID=653733 RepID=E6W6J0_DESIS|nr:dUTP diphosphatase [Desulfurispirillum indicum]ADU67325.1 deoxyuridine 5'-triphosphate nucleotidohydrolase Dut [Desulfurispirillum indicum S5]UCZ56687.1 dUTP diphosphatase [Desulfurispirillum indicum]
MKVKIMRLSHCYSLPQYNHPGDSGMDLFAAHGVLLNTGDVAKVLTGICLEVPEGYEGQIRPRSGMILNTHLSFEIGTVDQGYRGEVHVVVRNFGPKPYNIARGDRIAQLVIAPVVRAELEEVQELAPSQRGGKGLGSTGKR